MPKPWPWPGEGPTARARRIAQMYRAHLRSLNRELCDQVDATACRYGETWVVPQLVTVTSDQLLTPAQAADWLMCSTANIRRLRLAGRLPGVKTRDGWRYKLADLQQLQEQTRRRTRRRTPVVEVSP